LYILRRRDFWRNEEEFEECMGPTQSEAENSILRELSLISATMNKKAWTGKNPNIVETNLSLGLFLTKLWTFGKEGPNSSGRVRATKPRLVEGILQQKCAPPVMRNKLVMGVSGLVSYTGGHFRAICQWLLSSKIVYSVQVFVPALPYGKEAQKSPTS
jgi:hypothetical protein